MRTTLDLDPNILGELKKRKEREGKSLGQIASELLAIGLAESERRVPVPLKLHTQPMGALVDLEDHEAVRRAMAEPDHPG